MENGFKLQIKRIKDDLDWLYAKVDQSIFAYALEDRMDGSVGHYLLAKEVADWCWEHIGPYRVWGEWDDDEGDDEPDEDEDDEDEDERDDEWAPMSIMIEFKNLTDMMAFKLYWM